VGTFLFSILVHEIFIWGAMGHSWRFPWLGLASLCQLPLRPLLRIIPGIKGTSVGNFLFWVMLSTGLAGISLLYAHDMKG
jgi:hypothetical protein